MKAAQINSYGGKDVLQTVTDAPKPKPEPDQVLVEVHAASVNPFDWKVREGMMKEHLPLEFPATLGGDCAGVVAEVGVDVHDFAPGDEVYGQANAVSGNGSYAEFTPVKASSIGHKPRVDFVTAAALPLAGVSAYQALVEHLELKPDQKILIHGGAGGIASFAIQLAKHIGAYVASTAATEDLDYVRKLGADEAVDYKTQHFTKLLSEYDAVYDTVGGDTYKRSFQILKHGGRIVSMVEQPDEALMQQYGVTAIAQQTKVTTERLAELSRFIDEGAIKPQIDKTFPLEEAAEALQYIKEGKHHGKVVLKIK